MGTVKDEVQNELISLFASREAEGVKPFLGMDEEDTGALGPGRVQRLALETALDLVVLQRAEILRLRRAVKVEQGVATTLRKQKDAYRTVLKALEKEIKELRDGTLNGPYE